MKPLINPWFIYSLSILDALRNFFVVCLVAVCFCILLYVVLFFMAWLSENEALIEELKTILIKVHYKVWLFCFIVLLSIVIIFPGRNTIIAMYTTSRITKDNIEEFISDISLRQEPREQDVKEKKP